MARQLFGCHQLGIDKNWMIVLIHPERLLDLLVQYHQLYL
jgi:hypothetical protein